MKALPVPPPTWLTTSQAAEYLGIDGGTLRRLVMAGDLPAYRIGRNTRIKLAEIEAFVESCRVVPGAALDDEDGDEDDDEETA